MFEENLTSITGFARESVKTLIDNKPDWILGIIVFGSCVGFGKTHKYSDIDILFLTKEKGQEDSETSNRDIGKLLVKVDIPVDVLFMDIKEYVKQINEGEDKMDWLVSETYNYGVLVNLEENWRDYIEEL